MRTTYTWSGGVATQHLAYPRLFHAFASTSGGIGAAERALAEIADALARRLAAA